MELRLPLADLAVLLGQEAVGLDAARLREKLVDFYGFLPDSTAITVDGEFVVIGWPDGSASKKAEAERLAANAAKGASAEKGVIAKMGDTVAGTRVTLESSTTGRRSVADIVSKDKTVTEVKSGNAQLSQGQKDVKADIDAGREVIPRGQNAQRAGLTPNLPTKMNCYKVDRCP